MSLHESEYNSSFAEKLQSLRTTKKLTQRDFAKILGISPASLSAYETCSKIPSITVVEKIAKEFDVSIDWLCGIKQENEIKTYGDIIKILYNIGKKLSYDIDLQNDQWENKRASITFNNKKLSYILKDWQMIINALKANTIDEEIYNIWIEKKIKEYSKIKIDNDDFEDLPF